MKKCKKKKRGFIIFIVLFFAIFIALYSTSNAMMIEIGKASFQGVLSTASYYAIDKTLEDKFNYDSLITVSKNDNNEITMITTDSYKFNALTTKIADNVGDYLTKFIDSGIDVPIGVFTGIRLFQGFGKKVKMKLIAINSIKCEIYSKFESGGINQTRHTLYLKVTPDISVITRVTTTKLIDEIIVMLYDNVIVGKVPEIYFAGNVYSSYKAF